MPAITIPYSTHKNLMTTGGGTDRKDFRQKLVNYCNQGRTHRALDLVIEDYKDNDLLGPGAHPQYKKGWHGMLDYYHQDQIITDAQKKYLLKKL